MYNALDGDLNLIYYIPILGLMAGVGMVVYFWKFAHSSITVRRKNKIRNAGLGVVLGFIAVLGILKYTEYIEYSRLMNSHHLIKVVSGDVENFAYTRDSAGSASFSIKNINFWYYCSSSGDGLFIDYYSNHHKFRHTAVIKPNMSNVRITYLEGIGFGETENKILKIEKMILK
jgi:hypothetical protein